MVTPKPQENSNEIDDEMHEKYSKSAWLAFVIIVLESFCSMGMKSKFLNPIFFSETTN
jgi:hypothetical protein